MLWIESHFFKEACHVYDHWGIYTTFNAESKLRLRNHSLEVMSSRKISKLRDVYILEGWKQVVVAMKNTMVKQKIVISDMVSIAIWMCASWLKSVCQDQWVQQFKALKWSWGHFWPAAHLNQAELNWNLA